VSLPFFKSPIMLGQSHRAVVAQPTFTCAGVQRAYSRADYEAAMPDWYTRTHTEPDGTSVLKKVRPLNTSANVKAIIVLLRWSVRYNAMTKRVEITKPGLLVPGDDHENTVQTLLGDDTVRAGLSREGLSKLVDAVQQVWAEYMSMYQQGQRWTLDSETLAELNASNVDHTRIDPLYERIAAGFDWGSVAWDTFNPSCWQALRDVHWCTATDVCIAVEVERPTRTDATRAGVIVRELQLANVSISGQVNFSPAQRKSAGLSLLAVPIARVQRGQL
jgi:hypothetical protein